MSHKRFDAEHITTVVESDSGTTHTQAFAKRFTNCDRIVYALIAHGTSDIDFNVTIADDASGTTKTDLLTTPINATTAGSISYIDVNPAVLTATKQYLAPKVTVTSGNYTLLEIRYRLRDNGVNNLITDGSYQFIET
jgi:hypothetical protein